ncbi:pyrroline-5-carboxylate reductase [bacterium LRH843]|nr:pyrroline-5-carboxylate reductase [bacterium LRH843]
MLENKVITFLGAGSIAEAIIAGLIKHQIVKPEQIIATNHSNKQKLDALQNTYHIETTTDRNKAVTKGDIIVFAMKPKNIKEAIEDIQDDIRPNQLFVSVLAGIPTEYIEDLIGFEADVIRTMPNTSAKVGASATAISKGTYATDVHLKQVEMLFEAVGTVTVVDEKKLDAVTGLAGSGPAYFYYLIEAMEQAATDAGLSETEAKELITQTVVGVGRRLQSTTKSPKQLYTEVMSPQGTTEAGITVLRDRGAQEIIQKAVTEAIQRSKELGSVFSKN